HPPSPQRRAPPAGTRRAPPRLSSLIGQRLPVPPLRDPIGHRGRSAGTAGSCSPAGRYHGHQASRSGSAGGGEAREARGARGALPGPRGRGAAGARRGGLGPRGAAPARHALCEEFQVWLSAVTQIELEPTIDISCAKYEYTDVLLCHDDELEGRRIAFILYLVPPWEKSDGGTLDLYSTDEHFQPQQITKSLVPSWNTLVFFEVSPVSFHQVSEVLSQKCRLSVSGWFHGPSVARPARHIEAPLARSPHIPYDHEILYEWINQVYLDLDSQAQIQEEFEERSEILLKDFLKKEKYQLLCEALENKEIQWSSRGPANKRLYEAAEEDSLPDTLKKFLQLLRSEALFLLLSNFTGLKLHFLAPSDEDEDAGEGQAADTSGHSSPKPEQEEAEQPANGNSHQPHQPESSLEAQDSETQSSSGSPVCAGELRRWTHGHYTLVHDSQATEFALDLLFFCGCEGKWLRERCQTLLLQGLHKGIISDLSSLLKQPNFPCFFLHRRCLCRLCPIPHLGTNPLSVVLMQRLGLWPWNHLWPFPLAPGGGAWAEGKAEPPRPFPAQQRLWARWRDRRPQRPGAFHPFAHQNYHYTSNAQSPAFSNVTLGIPGHFGLIAS
uniref:Prolyl 3-hydroxylase OGFOD1 n=1 Tax=Junco hyemalis TaxID=40217 RepID=A0A8C5NRY7_JUNHY